MTKKNIGILLFDDVELLDFAGPLEVFTTANYLKEDGVYNTKTVGLTKGVTVSKSLLRITSTETLDESKGYDLFLIPGGFGTRLIMKNDKLLNRIDMVIKNSKKIATVCTGSLIVAKLGYLANKKATSHHLALDLLQKQDATIDVCKSERYVDNDRVITSAGVSAGIDMSLYIVDQDLGKEARKATASYMEYLG
ncbi:MAG: DJ-1/PfpI family protein [Saprospiraceae bacterium]